MQLLLNFRRWRVDQYEAIVQQLTPAALSAFVGRLFERLFMEALVVGNVTPEHAAAIAEGALAKVKAGWGSAPLWPGCACVCARVRAGLQRGCQGLCWQLLSASPSLLA
jgi:secreted Zn-dependent insulinase-like peptidase